MSDCTNMDHPPSEEISAPISGEQPSAPDIITAPDVDISAMVRGEGAQVSDSSPVLPDSSIPGDGGGAIAADFAAPPAPVEGNHDSLLKGNEIAVSVHPASEDGILAAHEPEAGNGHEGQRGEGGDEGGDGVEAGGEEGEEKGYDNRPAFSSRASLLADGVMCQVDVCRVDLSQCKEYYRRHRVCEMHAKASQVMLSNDMQRFCQQCSRFHSLDAFDDGKRSCRRRLIGHNKRRRKGPGDALMPFPDGGKAQGGAGGLEEIESAEKRARLILAEGGMGGPLPYGAGGGGGMYPGVPRGPYAGGVTIDRGKGSSVTLTPAEMALLLPHRFGVTGPYVNSAAAPAAASQAIPVDHILRQIPSNALLHMLAGGARLPGGIVLDSSVPGLLEQVTQAGLGPPSDAEALRWGQPGQQLPWNPEERGGGGSGLSLGRPPQPMGVLGVAPRTDLSLQLSPTSQREAEGGNVGEQAGQEGGGGEEGLGGGGMRPGGPFQYHQDQTGKISFKLFDRSLSDLPPDLRSQVARGVVGEAQILDWLRTTPAAMESFIRPGCVLITIVVRLPVDTWQAMELDWVSSLQSLVEGPGKELWGKGAVWAQAERSMAFIRDGKVSWVGEESSGKVAFLTGVSPLCMTAGGEEQEVTLEGFNLSLPDAELLCCWEGRVEKKHLELPPGSAAGQTGTGTLEAVRVAIPEAATRHQGRTLLEVGHVVGPAVSNSWPLLVADVEVASEINSLAGGGLAGVGLLPFLHELGWAMEEIKRMGRDGSEGEVGLAPGGSAGGSGHLRASQRCRHLGPEGEEVSAKLPEGAVTRLIGFCLEQRWTATVTLLLELTKKAGKGADQHQDSDSWHSMPAQHERDEVEVEEKGNAEVAAEMQQSVEAEGGKVLRYAELDSQQNERQERRTGGISGEGQVAEGRTEYLESMMMAAGGRSWWSDQVVTLGEREMVSHEKLGDGGLGVR